MVLSLAVTLLSAWTIDFETKATRIPLVLEQIQAKSGVKLSCDGVFESEVMLISARSVAPGKLLEKIADASAGEWEKKGDGLYLRPNMARRASEEKARLSLRSSRIQNILDSCKKEVEGAYVPDVSPTPSSPSNSVTLRKARNAPIQRCAMRLLISIGAEKLAQIPLGGRTVFAFTPNQNQAALPRDASQALKTFLEEWRVAEKAGAAPGGSSRITVPGEVINPDHPLPKIWLSVSDPLSHAIFPTIFLGMVDERGSGLGGGLDLEDLTPIVMPKFVPDMSEERLEYSRDTVAFKSFKGTQANRGRIPLASGSATAMTMARDEFEPLSLGTELLAQYAAKKGLNLVALVPDSAFRPLVSLQTATVKTVKECLDLSFSQNKADDGWLTLTPIRPADARRLRDNRKSARLLMKDAADGHVSLEREADYLLSRPIDSPVGLGMQMAQLMDGELPQQYPRHELRAKRLYGLLPREARRAGKFSFRNLPPGIRLELAKCVFQDGALAFHPEPGPFQRPAFDMFAINIGFSETTLVWPTGIPEAAVFEVSPSGSLAVRVSSSSQPYSNFGETIQLAAYFRFMRENPTLVKDPNDISRQIDRFQPLSDNAFGFVLRDNLWGTAYWAIERRSLGAPVPYERLPEELRTAIEKEKEQIKASRGSNPDSKLIQRTGNPPPSYAPSN